MARRFGECTSVAVESLCNVIAKVESVAKALTEKVRNHDVEVSYASLALDYLITVCALTERVMTTAVDSCRYGSGEMEVTRRVKKEFSHGNLDPLRHFMCCHLARTEEFSVEFREACRDISRCSMEAAMECKYKTREAQNKKLASRVVGGMASGVLLATDIGGGVTVVTAAASVVAGVFTYGVGTVVGLGITAGVVIVSG